MSPYPIDVIVMIDQYMHAAYISCGIIQYQPSCPPGDGAYSRSDARSAASTQYSSAFTHERDMSVATTARQEQESQSQDTVAVDHVLSRQRG